MAQWNTSFPNTDFLSLFYNSTGMLGLPKTFRPARSRIRDDASQLKPWWMPTEPCAVSKPVLFPAQDKDAQIVAYMAKESPLLSVWAHFLLCRLWTAGIVNAAIQPLRGMDSEETVRWRCCLCWDKRRIWQRACSCIRKACLLDLSPLLTQTHSRA